MNPEQRKLSAEFEASLRGGEYVTENRYHQQIADDNPGISVEDLRHPWIRVGNESYDPLDPTTPTGQIAAMELLQPVIIPLGASHLNQWMLNTSGQTSQWPTFGAAITAAWLAAAEKWKTTATPSDAAG